MNLNWLELLSAWFGGAISFAFGRKYENSWNKKKDTEQELFRMDCLICLENGSKFSIAGSNKDIVTKIYADHLRWHGTYLGKKE